MSDRGKGTKVYVGNLAVDANERDLRDTFERFGRLNDVWIARKPPGFGFVWYDDPRDADDAVKELDDRELLGKRMRVEISSSRGPGARGGGGAGGGSECYECGGRGHFARECPRRRGGGGGGGYGRRRSPSPYRRSYRSRSPRRSRSRSPRRSRSPPRRSRSPPRRSRSPVRRSRSPVRRSRTRSRSPVARRRSRSPVRDASPRRSASPPPRDRSASPRRSRSPSPRRDD